MHSIDTYMHIYRSTINKNKINCFCENSGVPHFVLLPLLSISNTHWSAAIFVACPFSLFVSVSLCISIFTALATFRSLSRKLGFSAPITLTLSLSHSSLESRALRAPFRDLDFLAVLGFTDLHSSCFDLCQISLFLRHVLEAHISGLFTCM